MGAPRRGSHARGRGVHEAGGLVSAVLVVPRACRWPARAATAAAATDKCPLTALKKAKKPVEITMWHSCREQNLETLTALTDKFNSSQSDVKVNWSAR